MLQRLLLVLIGLPLLVAAQAWGQPTSGGLLEGGPFLFRDVTRSAGLDGVYWKGAMRSGKIITSEGSGIAWGDYDGDGWLDLFLPQGVAGFGGDGNCGRLYRNDGQGAFEEVTDRAGLAPCGWGMGVLWEDLDADGALDLVATYVDRAEVWWNRGDGSFEPGRDLPVDCWSTGVAAFDLGADGDRDLYVACYLATSSEEEKERSALHPKLIHEYEAVADVVLRNEGDRRFSDVTHEVGLDDTAPGRGLTVAAADFDRDGRADLFVANDRDANHLFRGTEEGGLEEVGQIAGIAVGDDGRPMAAMGVAVGDIDGNGFPDLAVTNFSGEPTNLYLNYGEMLFVDEHRSWGLDTVTWSWLGWSTEMVDLDLDGQLDLYLAHAHLTPGWISKIMTFFDRREELASYFEGQYRQPFLLLRQEKGRLEEVLRLPEMVVRGASAADFDRNGTLDLFLYSSHRGTPSLLLVNEASSPQGWSELVLGGPGAPTPPAGTELTLWLDGEERVLQVVSGGSYLSGSSRPLHAGLGGARKLDVEWSPLSGGSRRRSPVPPGRIVVLP